MCGFVLDIDAFVLWLLHTQPVPCWHSFVYEAACAKGPDVGLGEIFDLATKLAKKAKTSAQKIAQMVSNRPWTVSLGCDVMAGAD